MKQLKIVGSLMLASFFVLTYLLYHNWNKFIFSDSKSALALPSTAIRTTTKQKEGSPMSHVPLDEIYPNEPKHFLNESFELEEETHNKQLEMLKTQGCEIPLAMLNYANYMKNDKKPTRNCGQRAVFLKKIDMDKVQALIKPKIIKRYLRKSVTYDCCYRFLSKAVRTSLRYGDKRIKFTKCAKFKDNDIITLETDFVNVQCFDYDKRNISHIIYDDMYAFAKRINVPKNTSNNCTAKYNVLMIGMDSMSLARFVQTMVRTAAYFEENYWLGFRGYHKVEDNTFPNLMALLTGRNLTDIMKKCTNKMEQCRDLFIWNKFKELGYVTAYGEDYLRLPDTFTRKYAFKTPPTDHYMRPFFLKGETELNNERLVCAGKVSSGQQLLNYAVDFANTYRDDQFFGFFWMNSYSHNANSRPQDADVMFENFFNQLGYTGVFRNTFVIALSDHGSRFGDRRLEMEAYYEERLPYLFVLTPAKFIGKYPYRFKSLAMNQFKLVTPYDLHHTLLDIYDISSCKNTSRVILEACPDCHSMFEDVSGNRTCRTVSISDKWCSCHKMYPLPAQDKEGEQSVQTVVSHLKTLVKTIKTKPCRGCMALNLKKIIRIHFYYHEDKTSLYYVVAFTMTPGNVSYEATVLLDNEGKRQIVGPVSLISLYRGFGHCTIDPKERLYCLCQKLDKC